jgi:hypothetical protein
LVIGCPFLHSKLNKNLETCGGGSVNAQTHHLKHSQFTKQSAVAIEQFAYSPFAQDEEHVAALALTPSSLPDNVKSIYVSMFSAHIYMSTSARTNFHSIFKYINIIHTLKNTQQHSQTSRVKQLYEQKLHACTHTHEHDLLHRMSQTQS